MYFQIFQKIILNTYFIGDKYFDQVSSLYLNYYLFNFSDLR